ncbi:tetratricopeptide repeat protein [Gloeocapsa sp. PCC 73106]|uniref:tetratricopeptide repeat protein n=1 Tax=Gloeocapsa sp. PCC 73106 TaxID=102232 RepID=UPI0002ABF360|nr:tetratricopeptide repeat protein [Gloeocapsa sp. PCC 73106]ELR97419.1 tetratricopeptide repeat protein [Gloeocapsa sp. PCC 73106]
MFTTNKEGNSEARDAQLVDFAAKAIYVENLSKAESLLLKVIQNTPATYLYRYVDNGHLVIKFWNSQELNHYRSWQKKQGIEESIVWQKSAYPRAYYFLGFLKIKTNEYQQAIEFLDKGLKIEPSNPKFLLEKAKALVGLNLHQQALRIYDSINQLGPYISKYDIAKALQERGTMLLTLGDIDRAEQTYHQSLNWEADNEIVINQLNKIQELRENKSGRLSSILTTDSHKLKDNATYQSFLEQRYINQFKAEQSSAQTGLAKLKNRAYLLALLSTLLIICTTIVSLFS